MGAAHIEMLTAYLREQERPVLNIQNIESFLSGKANYLLAYIEDARIIGLALAYTLQRYDGKADMMYLHEVDVIEPARRKGIGKALIENIRDLCRAEGIMKLFLITNKSNIPAVGLYESLGASASSEDDLVYSLSFSETSSN
jgi:aminoglycoside 6'-N-acetyltransferase I